MNERSPLLIQQENLELSKENQALKETVTKLLEEVDRLRNLPAQLEGNVTRINKSPELQIIEDQINLLNLASRGRVLTLEEIRSLDLLVKNKKLIEPSAPVDAEYTKVSEGMAPDDLLRIAGDVPVSNEQPKARKVKSRTKTGSEDPVA